MDTAKVTEPRPNEQQASAGRIVSLGLKDRTQELSREAGPKRDWSAALNIVNDCFEAIRDAEERVIAADTQRNQLAQRLDEQAKTYEARVVAANKRADVAEARLREAEEWLARFHDTIMTGFEKTFAAS